MKKHKLNTSLKMIKRHFPLVEVVKDADHPAVVEVTPSDNAHSDVRSHLTCALAVACKRYFHADGVIIGLTTSWIIKGRVAVRFHNSGTTSREITSFDRKAGFDVGEYLLSPQTGTSKLGSTRNHRPYNKGSGRKRSFRHYTRNVRSTLRGNLSMEPV